VHGAYVAKDEEGQEYTGALTGRKRSGHEGDRDEAYTGKAAFGKTNADCSQEAKEGRNFKAHGLVAV
jgi:hypothetical protein